MNKFLEENNQMLWIRNIKFVKKSKKQFHYYQEYEIASECYITGVLDYENGLISCSLLAFEKDRNGLYRYNLKIKHSLINQNEQNTYSNVSNHNKHGYYFKDGIQEELVSLFSLFFQCRFYIIANVSTFPGSNRKIRYENDLTYKSIEHVIHPTIFPNKNKSQSFSIGLVEFLDKIILLPMKFHQNFLWAAYHYSKALRQVGIDTEMVFIRLVSAVEILSKEIEINPKVDIFIGKKLSQIIDLSSLTKEQKEELENIFSVRNSRLRFQTFIENHCSGFFKGGKSRAEHCKIRRSKLIDILKTIYKARSAYLHRGELMYLSRPFRMKEAKNWDTEPSGGMIIDNKFFKESEKLPYAHFFESLIRCCLINFLNKNTKIKDS